MVQPEIQDLSNVNIKILEQPASNEHRFRYRSEGKSVGALPGANSTAEVKTYPMIKVTGYQGPATVLVSCIEADKPYRTHPYNLNGRHCKKGICRVDVSSKTDMTAVFSKIAIESVKKQDIPQSLAKRQELSIDPFGQGFDTMKSKTDIASIELNQIRLCFQVFIPGDQSQYVAGPIAVSNVIKDKRIHEDLSIINISENYATVNGGKKILLFTSKICKDDIQVRFSCNYNNKDYLLEGNFGPNNVHKQHAISFTTPILPDQSITQEIHAKIYLFRPKDKMESKSKDFYFQPNRNHKTKTDLKIVRPTEKKVTKKSEVFSDLKRGISKPIKRNNLDFDIKEESSKSSSRHDLKLPTY